MSPAHLLSDTENRTGLPAVSRGLHVSALNAPTARGPRRTRKLSVDDARYELLHALQAAASSAAIAAIA